MNTAQQYEIVVGLEVHAQLLTRSKLFTSDTLLFGQEPNTQVSVITLAHPGTLPKLNTEAIRLAIRLGLACNCTIETTNYFARKNYFYPDLPKGYQISQHTTPICRDGFLEVTAGGEKSRIRINRIHIEEDAGKSIHDEGHTSSIDYNRAGTPLLEIVTEPDIRSSEEAFAYVTELRNLVRHLGVCDGNMKQGSLRCDVNISVRKRGETRLGTKVEIKNLNSIRFIRKAIEHERERLINLIESGGTVIQQTRGFDDATFTTYEIRTKEDADDYRYFADPDLPPFIVTEEMIGEVRSAMPPLQKELASGLVSSYGLSDNDAGQLAGNTDLYNYYKELATHTGSHKAAANWVLGPVKNWLDSHEKTVDEFGVEPQTLAKLIQLVEDNKLNHGVAVNKILPALAETGERDAEAYASRNDLFIQTSETEVDSWIEAALSKHAQKITEYKKGKKGLISLFVGEVMKLSRGKADAKSITDKITEKLKA